ncbi:ATP-dependent helicase [Lysobacter yananisis]|uniref:DNA 3'-5' helicase n=1 Tax=Lysobacter yananisis TaxID=1003114 RepID=A0ABY9P7J2_9GAMM|nr:ATP-dependent helicase [Lysobacter yananisis]WMT02961.1 ATP-dependent helicase [Lysobacter yananisis]
MSYIRSEDWRLRGIESFEDAAWRALCAPGSACVVAGPGSGKTEFLAQRAAYLLETGQCPAPQRLLAISFKRDAAKNLALRVRERCPPEIANRFDSYTFDALAKQLVDRFHPAIPAQWRPSSPYRIAYLKPRDVEAFFSQAQKDAPLPWQREIAGIKQNTFEAERVGAYRLPVAQIAAASGSDYAIHRWWALQLATQPSSSLTFISINRLAELLIRASPYIRRALRATYPFVFVDEFQDTTFAQYDFLLSVFGGGSSRLTVVGDNKQRIMVWAGARVDAFERFTTDFSASSFALLCNFRSTTDLVRIQNVVARALDSTAPVAVARASAQISEGVAQVWRSSSKAQEVNHIARWIATDMQSRQRQPRDYAILVRQRADDYEAELSAPFARLGLRLRNEARNLGDTTLQDLLADDLARIFISLLRLGSIRRAPVAWKTCTSALLQIRGVMPDDIIGQERIEDELSKFKDLLRADMKTLTPHGESAEILLMRIKKFLDLNAVVRAYPEYNTGELATIMLEAFRLHFIQSTEGATDWTECLDAFEGASHIPLLTVHKSKGLEYDTTIFVGLDDRAWWAHTPGNSEGLATFFVALSRAKQRAIFAFCQERGGRSNVAELFKLLADAGVPEIAI